VERRDEKNLGELIELLEGAFEEVHIIQRRATEALFLLRAECRYRNFRVKITEIVDNQGRNYSFYLLRGDTVIVGFDNSEDRRAQILKYGKRNWKKHFRERVPHLHTFDRKEMRLTDEMSVVDFITWLRDYLDIYLADYPTASSNIEG